MGSQLDPGPVDPIGPWSAQKHQLLHDYLSSYTTVMKGQRWCRDGYHYIDAFAGSGRPVLRDAHEQRYIDGSPRIALGIPNPFTTYTFIEMEPWRVARLRELKDEFPDRTIRVVPGDCNEVIVEKITPRIRHERFNRGFIFLDPFGINLAWETIEAVAETGALEIFLNFPTMGLNRAALHNELDGLTAERASQMNRVWGSEGWRDLIYERRQGLWEAREFKKAPTRAEHLGRLFIEHRLAKVFRHVSDPIVMTNSHGAPVYCLIFAGHNETGAKIAGSIFDRHQRRATGPQRRAGVDPTGTLPLIWTG